MPQACRESELRHFEVILYFENNSWLFSTCAYSFHRRAALEVAERNLSIHALHHKLGIVRAGSACVLDQFDNYYFAKRNGRWQVQILQDRLKPTPVACANLQSKKRFPGFMQQSERSAEYPLGNTNRPENRRR